MHEKISGGFDGPTTVTDEQVRAAQLLVADYFGVAEKEEILTVLNALGIDEKITSN
ncbi:hypothetical protein KC874_02960 [Candidatus Saccharibacteria bacterium]|nr:hypothetical protein [Candidatus Saccharibacteria bacterium]